MTGVTAWAAAALGWTAMWLCGRNQRTGWLLTVLASGLWLAINASLHVWAGVVASAVAAVIAAWNWLRWHAAPQPDSEPAPSPTGAVCRARRDCP
ncbi:MAG TPA: nicotinamide mononucleotide transporter [Mycobacteriales bacterium]|jgi:tetrahydromethanopterin S-methyltransferase subunit H|nr:nicotinamide mononucleotide transporter [Mycobacteriales bacterium]